VVQIKSPGGKSTEEVQDDVGDALRDGLAYDDAANLIDVATGQNVDIDGSGLVQVPNQKIQETAVLLGEGFAPEFTG
jgi:hypothetical protein